MSVATGSPVVDRRAALAPVPPASLPFILRCTDDDTIGRAQLDRPATP